MLFLCPFRLAVPLAKVFLKVTVLQRIPINWSVPVAWPVPRVRAGVEGRGHRGMDVLPS